MLQFLIVFLFFLVAMGIMLASLYFSKYKQRDESCCGGGHCSSAGATHSDHECKKDQHDFINKINIDKLQV